MLDATRTKYRSISFEKLNVDDPSVASLKQQYNISGIPCLVFLDASNRVLYNGGVPYGPKGLEWLIDTYQ
ncbi:MAG: hypothetical protein K8F91_16960 [Candidatus Obscuribacterales bacterium]|nr:hypothetical protein [Candidatus Obscuribacterales bacterium]